MPSTKKSNRIVDKKFVFPELLNEAAVRHNNFLLDYCQTSVSALSGSAAGIIGLTGFNGFFFYFFCSLFLSLIIFFYLNDTIKSCFTSKKSIITENLWSGIQTYLLFWTFLYGMVHVY